MTYVSDTDVGFGGAAGAGKTPAYPDTRTYWGEMVSYPVGRGTYERNRRKVLRKKWRAK